MAKARKRTPKNQDNASVALSDPQVVTSDDEELARMRVSLAAAGTDFQGWLRERKGQITHNLVEALMAHLEELGRRDLSDQSVHQLRGGILVFSQTLRNLNFVESQPVKLGSLNINIGDLKAAAGQAGMTEQDLVQGAPILKDSLAAGNGTEKAQAVTADEEYSALNRDEEKS